MYARLARRMNLIKRCCMLESCAAKSCSCPRCDNLNQLRKPTVRRSSCPAALAYFAMLRFRTEHTALYDKTSLCRLDYLTATAASEGCCSLPLRIGARATNRIRRSLLPGASLVDYTANQCRSNAGGLLRRWLTMALRGVCPSVAAVSMNVGQKLAEHCCPQRSSAAAPHVRHVGRSIYQLNYIY